MKYSDQWLVSRVKALQSEFDRLLDTEIKAKLKRIWAVTAAIQECEKWPHVSRLVMRKLKWKGNRLEGVRWVKTWEVLRGLEAQHLFELEAILSHVSSYWRRLASRMTCEAFEKAMWRDTGAVEAFKKICAATEPDR